MWEKQITADEREQSLVLDGKEMSAGYAVDEVPESTANHEPADVEASVPAPVHLDTDAATLAHEGGAEEVLSESPVEHSVLPSDVKESAEVLPQEDISQAPGDNVQGEAQVDESKPPATYASVAASEPGPEAVVAQLPKPATPEGPVAFPTSNDNDGRPSTPVPVAFPQAAPSPGVTFSAGVDSPPSVSRTGTPDPDSEPKRKRISSQNFQRIARRLSLGGRKSSSGGIATASAQSLSGDSASIQRDSKDDESLRGETGSQDSSVVDKQAGQSSAKGKKKGKKSRKGTK